MRKEPKELANWITLCRTPNIRKEVKDEALICLQVICHGIPDKRPLEEGDIVNVDVTAYYQGYHGDLNETFVVGEVDEESKKLIKITYEANYLLIPHTPINDLKGKEEVELCMPCRAHSICRTAFRLSGYSSIVYVKELQPESLQLS